MTFRAKWFVSLITSMLRLHCDVTFVSIQNLKYLLYMDGNVLAGKKSSQKKYLQSS